MHGVASHVRDAWCGSTREGRHPQAPYPHARTVALHAACARQVLISATDGRSLANGEGGNGERMGRQGMGRESMGREEGGREGGRQGGRKKEGMERE
eukprot:182707-Chlamydomonas_euryale.AAC.1